MENSRNVIIKDVRFSKVIQFDEIEINTNTKNVWIDHCEFYTDLDHDVDYYDGLLDIKNQSRFLTFSWTKFHDHQKCILMSSGDTQDGDTVIRATFHHNHFYNANSRLPSLRFGKAHIFNNYYKNISTGINSRMNACIRVENNYFEDAGTGVGMLYSPTPGAVELINNTFINTSYSEEPACVLDVPYEYVSWLDDTEDIPQLVSDSAGPRYPVIDATPSVKADISALRIYPNPAGDNLKVCFTIRESQQVSISIIHMPGKETLIKNDRETTSGWNELEINTSEFPAGVYLLKLETTKGMITRQLIID
jgi:pectate lyase